MTSYFQGCRDWCRAPGWYYRRLALGAWEYFGPFNSSLMAMIHLDASERQRARRALSHIFEVTEGDFVSIGVLAKEDDLGRQMTAAELRAFMKSARAEQRPRERMDDD